MFNQVFGKTLGGKASNIFGIKPVPNSPYWSVANLKFYFALSTRMSIKLESGYLFRTTDHHGNIVDAPFIGSAVQNWLKNTLNSYH